MVIPVAIAIQVNLKVMSVLNLVSDTFSPPRINTENVYWVAVYMDSDDVLPQITIT
jgi:hypothetical protein